MKPRTKEENATYGRAQRLKKKLAAVSPCVSPRTRITRTVLPKIATPAPCQSCATHAAALAIAQERIVTLEAQLTAARRIDTATPSAHKVTPEDAEALRQRVIAAKVDRINSFGKNPSIGIARI